MAKLHRRTRAEGYMIRQKSTGLFMKTGLYFASSVGKVWRTAGNLNCAMGCILRDKTSNTIMHEMFKNPKDYEVVYLAEVDTIPLQQWLVEYDKKIPE